MPTHQELVIPVLQAVVQLGGSAKSREIVDTVVENLPNSDELMEMVYPKNPDSAVLPNRIAFGRSLAKRIGALEQPNTGLYLITPFGEELLAMPHQAGFKKILELKREEDKRRRQEKGTPAQVPVSDPEDSDEELVRDLDSEDDDPNADWKTRLLKRLHELSPEAFEKFVIYLLRRYGLELDHTGAGSDEGIDAIGTAPISPVLSSRVAVQVKRYDPVSNKPIGRETVALFQRDAQTKGAERAILVTLSRFTKPARAAATAATPTVDLISGDRLAELIRDDGESGVQMRPTVDYAWFDRFE